VLELSYQISSLTAQFHHAADPPGLQLFTQLCTTVLTVLGKAFFELILVLAVAFNPSESRFRSSRKKERNLRVVKCCMVPQMVDLRVWEVRDSVRGIFSIGPDP
jgi:hypothetical protein